MDRSIPFEKLINFRDLGGMTGADGRKIKPGMIIRGGNLHGASEKDIEKLSEMLDLIVDFRTEGEIAEQPDPEIPGVEYWHLPVLATLTEGVSREKEADKNSFQKFMMDPQGAEDYMKKTYAHMAVSEFALSQQKLLLERLLNPGRKAVLFHCTAGKDRTGGFASIFEAILGVDKDDILEDYLLTNEASKENIDRMIAHITSRPGLDKERVIPALQAMFGARESYFNAFMEEAERVYGSLDGFMEKALGIGEEEKNRFRKLYLEP